MTLLSKWKEEDEAIEISKNQDEPDWKAVGSRRGSLSTRVVDINNNNNTSSSSSSSSTFSMINERRPSLLDNKQWGSFNGFQWDGPSIFDDDNNSSNTSKSPLAPDTPDIYDPLLCVPMVPFESNIYKQKQRSMSFSIGQNHPHPFFSNNNIDDEDLERHYKSALAPTMEEEEDDDAYFRTRSQSSNAAFGSALLSSYWMNRNNHNNYESDNRRRPSLGFIPTTSASSSFLSPQSSKSSLLFQRRMSQPCSTNYTFPDIPNGVPPPPNTTNSLFGISCNNLSDRLEHINLSSKYPENNPNLPQVIFAVEFKSGRKDYYYYTETLNIGDLVIVEADRGKDLGKIASGSLTIEQVKTDNDEEERQIKRIYRQATPDEINLLITKKQDEQHALEICLQKIKTRKLPMDVVDAEYQWDRRKLTFYFIAERRIDFRELVRELFKIYKTRIWMCAVNGSSTIMSEKQNNTYY